MRRRYDQRLSDNYMYTGKVSYVCSGNGTLFVYTGFPVTSATVGWVVYPFIQDEEMSSSSETSSDSSFGYSSISLSSLSDSTSSGSTEIMSSSSFDISSSETSISMSDSSLSSQTEIISGLPRLYVSSCATTGFTVTYENIPPQIGYIEFSFNAV